MLEEWGSIPLSLVRARMLLTRTGEAGRVLRSDARVISAYFGRILRVVCWHILFVPSFLLALTISSRSEDLGVERVPLPIEIVGIDGTTVSTTVVVQRDQAESVRSLWLQVHGIRYSDQASVQVNTSNWLPLRNDTVTIAEPARSFGGIGGFATLQMTLPLPKGSVVGGPNIVRFR